MPPGHKGPQEREQHGAGTRQWALDVAECPALGQMDVLSLGYSEARTGYEVVRLRPQFSNLNVTLSGAGEMLIEGKWRTIRGGMASFSPVDALQGARMRSRGCWRFCWVCFKEKSGRSIHIPMTAPSIQFVDPRPISWVIQGLEREFRHGGQRLMLDGWLQLLDLHLKRVTGAALSENRLWVLWDAVAKTPAKRWTETEIGRLARVGPRQVLRLCRKECGRSLRAQIMHIRLTKAAALLRDSRMKLQGVAELVGYRDAFAFSKAFRRWSGKSPREYRK